MAEKTYDESTREVCAKHGVKHLNDYPDHPMLKEGYTITFMGRLTKPPSAGPKPTDELPSETKTPTEPEA